MMDDLVKLLETVWPLVTGGLVTPLVQWIKKRYIPDELAIAPAVLALIGNCIVAFVANLIFGLGLAGVQILNLAVMGTAGSTLTFAYSKQRRMRQNKK
jgi:hypothetical protein